MERSFLVVTSQRTSCPHCQQPLQQAKPGQTGGVSAQIIAEPAVLKAWHLSRFCPASVSWRRTGVALPPFVYHGTSSGARGGKRWTCLTRIISSSIHAWVWQRLGCAAGGTECLRTEPAFREKGRCCDLQTPTSATTSAISFETVGCGRSSAGELLKLVLPCLMVCARVS